MNRIIFSEKKLEAVMTSNFPGSQKNFYTIASLLL